MKEITQPKIKQLLSSTILITGEQSSKLILSPNEGGGLKSIQTVVKVGPHIKAENGYNINAGDKVLLNLEGLFKELPNGTVKQVQAIGQPLAFDNKTGEYKGYIADEAKDQSQYWLIDSRRILMVFEE
jgi:hypothetical protein